MARANKRSRREAIRRILEENGGGAHFNLINAQLEKDYGSKVSDVTLYNDLRLLSAEGYAVEVHRKMVSLKSTPLEFEKREGHQKIQKAAIGSLIKRLCFISESPFEDSKSTFGWLYERAITPISTDLENRLKHFSRQRQRFLSLDSGTTTMACARLFASVDLPTSDVSALTILTNSPKIGEALIYTNDWIEVILIPGYLRKSRISLVGFPEWLERFEADVAVIGATGWSKKGFSADSVLEARIKQAFLENSKIRIIVADASKLDEQEARFVTFAGNFSGQVALVVTDESVRKEKYLQFRQAMQESNISVVVAEQESS